MITLAIDTANENIAIALLNDTEVLADINQTMPRGQGEALIPMIRNILTKANLSPADIHQIAVTLGPGSFTGVRIAMATARGMALALNIPIYGTTTLEAAAFQTTGKVLSVLDTKRGDFYTQLFQDGQPLEDPAIRTPEQMKSLSGISLVGSSAPAVAEQTGFPVQNPPLSPAIAVALSALTQKREAIPYYLRDADVSC